MKSVMNFTIGKPPVLKNMAGNATGSTTTPNKSAFNAGTTTPSNTGFNAGATAPSNTGFNVGATAPSNTGFNVGTAAPSNSGFNFGTTEAGNSGFNVGSGNTATPAQIDATTHQGMTDRLESFKNKGAASDKVSERRARALAEQKQKRHDFVNHMRTLTEELFDEIDEEVELQTRMETGAVAEYEKPTADRKLTDLKYRAGRRRSRMSEQRQLMLSEWFTEKPEDFDDQWMMVPVPKGKRNLVIASRGKTLCFAKSGIIVEEFPSMLPGGCHTKANWNSECCILDTVFNEDANTFYVLDMMCWRSHTLYEAETEFRFYWMNEKLSETPHILHYTKQNKYRFEPLPNFRCDKENMKNFMHTILHLPLDGLLFYHKQTGYTFGPTPLVLWLKPWMVSEALGIDVHRTYTQAAPQNYKGFKAHLETIAQDKLRIKSEGFDRHKGKGKRGKGRKSSESMDTTEKGAQGTVGIAKLGSNFVKGGTLAASDSGATSMDM